MRSAAALVCALVVAAGCGGGPAVDALPPPKVPVSLVPGTLQAGRLKLIENIDPSTTNALRSDEPRVLIADGRLWEVRDGQRLVGALEIATVKNTVRLRRNSVRQTIVRNVMPARVERLDVGELTVYATAANDKIVYLWFGKKLFQILQLKGSALDPEALLNEIVEFQTATDELASFLLLDTE